jgi:transposase-like protein
MDEYPQNVNELKELFESEGACLQYIMKVKWPEGFACEKCLSRDYWLQGSAFTCKACRHKTFLLAGTVFQDTKLPLRTWFRAIWEVIRKKAGTSALSLQSELKLSYKTAWTILHKLRRAMIKPGRNKLKGIVEVDETLYGGLEEGRPGGGSLQKALIAVATELKGAHLGRIRMSIVQSGSFEHLGGFISENVEPGSSLITDGWCGYSPVKNLGYAHKVQELSEGSETLPHVHLVISLLKRWLLGTHQGGVSRNQLEFYLDEFVFRFNRRASASRTLLFHRLIEGAVEAPPVPFKLIRKGQGSQGDPTNTECCPQPKKKKERLEKSLPAIKPPPVFDMP